MEILLFLMYAVICILVVSQVVLWNFMELRNKRPKDENGVNTSSPGSGEETQPPRDDASTNNEPTGVSPRTSVSAVENSFSCGDTNATQPPRLKRKKKDGEGSSKSTPFCRFCKQVFTSPQALGGHMNRHRGEREKEEFQKAEILIHAKGQNFALGYPSGGAGPSYYQPEGNCGHHYQGGGTQMANVSMVGNMGAAGLQRQAYQNFNQQFVGAPQMNPNYGTHQQTAQANYQPQPQHGGPYVNYNQSDNAPRPPHIPGGVPQTSYMPRANSGQYQTQGTGSVPSVRPYAMPHGGTSTGVAHHQSTSGFNTGHSLSQAAGGANMPTVDIIATLGSPAALGSNANAGLRQSTANQAVAQFVDQCGNIVIQGPSSGLYSTGLRPLNPSHFLDNIHATEYEQGQPQASYAGISVHGTIQVQSDQYNATVGMENQYHAPGVDMLNFQDAQEGDEFGIGGPDLSTIALTEPGHGSGVSTGRSADARSHL